MGKLYILNTLIVPIDFNKYPEAKVIFRRVSIGMVWDMIRLFNEIVKSGNNQEETSKVLSQVLGFNEIISAIGHEGTVKVLSQILGIEVPVNRISVFFEPGDRGLHFFLKQRLPEGVVLSEEELKKLDYWLVYSIVS